jgi:hypothetical protein
MNRQVSTADERYVKTAGGARGSAAPRERLGSPRRRLATLALASSVVVAFPAAANAPAR